MIKKPFKSRFYWQNKENTPLSTKHPVLAIERRVSFAPHTKFWDGRSTKSVVVGVSGAGPVYQTPRGPIRVSKAASTPAPDINDQIPDWRRTLIF